MGLCDLERWSEETAIDPRRERLGVETRVRDIRFRRPERLAEQPLDRLVPIMGAVHGSVLSTGTIKRRFLARRIDAQQAAQIQRAGERQSLFRYFHGRSSLTTWLRAVLAQRHVDRLRADRRLQALPDDESPEALPAPRQTIDPERQRNLTLMCEVLERAVATLAARDRLRLACYYAQELTLAETGRILGEHEATTSRQLARTRKLIRDEVQRQLKVERGLTDAEIAECFDSVADDAGTLDLQSLLSIDPARKESALDRSS